ncbi:MAG: tripartite tricarboxylate transporter TctB family protein [Hyphomicrobiaceae bacterium]
MTLERGIAAIFLVICVGYGYTAFVTMENDLLPFELNMSFLPNTMPKVLSVVGAIVALVILAFSSPPGEGGTSGQLDLSKLEWPHIAQAVGLLLAMVAYALLLRPLGFVASTTLFLAGSSILLGERKLHLLIPIALIAAFAIWFLVERLLDIVLKPWPWFISA